MRIAQLDLNKLEDINYQKGFSFNFAGQGVGVIISSIIPYLFSAAGILLLLYLLFGGLQLMLSRGDPKAIEAAKSKITNAFVGFLIVFAAYWIVQILGQLLGLETSTFGGLFSLGQ